VNKRPHICLSCNNPLSDNIQFCPNCGQKAIYNNLSIKYLFKNFFDSFLNFDVKLLRSLRDVWIPNKMVKAYISGNRTSYLNPFRFYFISLLIFFALVSLNMKKASLGDEEAHAFKYELQEYDNFSAIKPSIDSISGNIGLSDSIEVKLFSRRIRNADRDSNELNMSIIKAQTYKISRKDKFTMEPDSLIKHYNIEGSVNQFFLKQMVKIELEPGMMLRHSVSNMLWGIILITVIIAFVLKLLYIRHSIYYVEHFFLVSHFHCLTLILVSVLFLLKIFVKLPDFLFGTAITIGALHFIYSLKSYTNQGWFKTIIKTIFIFFSYIFGISLVAVIIFLFTMMVL